VTHLRKMMLGGNSSVATPSKTHFGSWISAYFPAFVTVLLQFLVDRRTPEVRKPPSTLCIRCGMRAGTHRLRNTASAGITVRRVPG